MFGRRRGGTIGLVGAQQLLGVGGALTLANMLKDLIFWADLLKAVFEGWAEIVQVWLWPVGEFLFGWAFDLLRLADHQTGSNANNEPYRNWVRTAIDNNMPWNDFVHILLSAEAVMEYTKAAYLPGACAPTRD
jgi:hypothetical protein